MFEENVINPFLEIVNSKGDLNAFCISDRYYTYSEFAVYVATIAESINKINVSGKNIGLVVNDDIETYASIFALWMGGFAYVPLHPQQPLDRGIEIIREAEIRLVLDSSDQQFFSEVNTIALKKLTRVKKRLTVKIHPDNLLAYILFTSGSTGKPKGVQITRKNVGAFMESFMKTGIVLGQTDRCLQSFDLTFDVSVQSFLAPLTRGACVYTVPHDQIKYSYIYGLLDKYKLTFGAMAPSMIRYLKPYFDEITVTSMCYNILTAEASPLDLVDEWSKCIPNSEIYDFYGPTEGTIYCTYQKYIRRSENKQLNGMLSIGKAMPGITAIIINEKQQILKANQKGELCISGDQITPGYWKNSQKNTEAFFNKNIEGISARFYRTGDLCFFDEEGDIMLAGRIDHQVKIQGYRVELGEIEYHAREWLKGQNAVASTYVSKRGITDLVLFIEGAVTENDKLIKYMKTKMPSYMVPTKILTLSVFPINQSGKVDRLQLKRNLENAL